MKILNGCITMWRVIPPSENVVLITCNVAIIFYLNCNHTYIINENVHCKSSLLVPNFQNFPGGACPQTPLALACFACSVLCTL